MDQWIKLAKGFILVFALDDQESLDAIKTKIKRIEKHEKSDLPIILVGNKCDLVNKRKITQQQGEDLAKSIKGKYYESTKYHVGFEEETPGRKRVFASSTGSIGNHRRSLQPAS